eukprot:m.428628 g.428628  ORF g.428628 m.428628 type:complete len:340 (-) comp56708_c0_seq15:979-1998(-)
MDQRHARRLLVAALLQAAPCHGQQPLPCLQDLLPSVHVPATHSVPDTCSHSGCLHVGHVLRRTSASWCQHRSAPHCNLPHHLCWIRRHAHNDRMRAVVCSLCCSWLPFLSPSMLARSPTRLFHLMTFMTSVAMLLTLAAFVVGFYDLHADFWDFDQATTRLVWLVVIVMGLPFVLTFLQSLSFGFGPFVSLLKAYVPFVVFMPMIVAVFGAYSFSRLSDLTWGNRPSSALDTLLAKERKKIEENLKAKADSICAFIVMANVFFVIFVAAFSAIPQFLFYLGVSISIAAIIQMLLSGVYLIWLNFTRLVECFGCVLSSCCCMRSARERRRAVPLHGVQAE